LTQTADGSAPSRNGTRSSPHHGVVWAAARGAAQRTSILESKAERAGPGRKVERAERGELELNAKFVVSLALREAERVDLVLKANLDLNAERNASRRAIHTAAGGAAGRGGLTGPFIRIINYIINCYLLYLFIYPFISCKIL
jgi:hypothetical protein